MRRTKFPLTAILAVFLCGSVWAQDEKSTVKLDLVFTQVNNDAPVLKVSAKIKSGKRFEPLQGAEISMSLMEVTPNGLLGKIITDRKGNASITLPPNVSAKLDSLSPFKFIASLGSSDHFNAAETEIEITRARIELSLTDADSTRRIDAKVLALIEGRWTAVPETEVKLFVKRLYSDLPVGEDVNATSEDGTVSADFNITIPGDYTGNIMVGAKLDQNETYGTICAMKSVAWGVHQKRDNSFSERSLWASRDKTPLWLLIFPNAIIAVVWGTIFYLFYLLFRIRKIGIKHGNV